MCFYFTLVVVFLFSSSQVLLAAELTSQSKQKLNDFSEQLDALKKEHKILGFAAGVVKDDQLIWSQGYGFVDSDKTVAMTPDTPMWIASVTKAFVGLAFLKLEFEGLVDLTDKAADTPDFTGLCEWLNSTTIPFGKDLRCELPMTIENILNHQVNGEPGTAFLYNPIMYSRLSRYLEHKFGEGIDAVEGRHNFLAQVIDRTILNPAGMNRTMSSQWHKQKAMVYFDLATGYSIKDGRYQAQPRPERHIAGGAGVVSTVLDLAKFDVALNTGLITDKKLQSKLFAPAKFNSGKLSPYGYGWYFENYHNERLMWHSGWDEEAGFSALYLKVPKQKLTFIILANTEGLWWGNSLDKAEVHKSPFAQLFLTTFVD